MSLYFCFISLPLRISLPIIDLFKDVAKLLGEHRISVAGLPGLVHVLASKGASIELALHHGLPSLSSLIETFLLLRDSRVFDVLDFIDRGNGELLFSLLLVDGLLVVDALHFAQVLEVGLQADHLVVGDSVEVLARTLVLLCEHVVLCQIFLLQAVNGVESSGLSRFCSLESQLFVRLARKSS